MSKVRSESVWKGEGIFKKVARKNNFIECAVVVVVVVVEGILVNTSISLNAYIQQA